MNNNLLQFNNTGSSPFGSNGLNNWPNNQINPAAILNSPVVNQAIQAAKEDMIERIGNMPVEEIAAKIQQTNLMFSSRQQAFDTQIKMLQDAKELEAKQYAAASTMYESAIKKKYDIIAEQIKRQSDMFGSDLRSFGVDPVSAQVTWNNMMMMNNNNLSNFTAMPNLSPVPVNTTPLTLANNLPSIQKVTAVAQPLPLEAETVLSSKKTTQETFANQSSSSPSTLTGKTVRWTDVTDDKPVKKRKTKDVDVEAEKNKAEIRKIKKLPAEIKNHALFQHMLNENKKSLENMK